MKSLSDWFPPLMRVWLLPAACLLIAGALAAVILFDVPASRLLLWALVLACPLSHLLMGHGGHGSSHESGHSTHTIPAAVARQETDVNLPR